MEIKKKNFLYCWIVAFYFIIPSSFPFNYAIAAELDKITCTTDCNAECLAKFPGVSNFFKQLECRGKCFDVIPSCMPTANPSFDFLQAKQQYYEERLLTHFISREQNFSYIISRDKENNPIHQGDSLLWSSLAMGILPCEKGTEIQNSLAKSLQIRNGAFVRFEPLPGEYADNSTSRDQETGVLFGLAMRMLRCPSHLPEIKSMWELHRKFIAEHGSLCASNHLNCRITKGISFLMRQLSFRLGLEAVAPSGGDKAIFEAEMVASSMGVRIGNLTCYPIHLNTLQAITAEILDRPIKKRVYKQICNDSLEMNIPLVDWYCNRESSVSILNWVANFDNEDALNKPEYRYEYRHQRCGKREHPDLKEGASSPGIDFLMLIKLAGGWNR
ncbi:MAG: hypothetical protein HQK50_10055 [Oligoflexia bacterium]|nr:hypothetical protein [Oligoflexia bacterium]MBF0365903.1 hypothetical protein [Oligoflexia bacterium]